MAFAHLVLSAFVLLGLPSSLSATTIDFESFSDSEVLTNQIPGLELTLIGFGLAAARRRRFRRESVDKALARFCQVAIVER